MKNKVIKTGIYKFTSQMGRIYIGQSKDIDKRYKAHLAYKGDGKLQSSFKLYGFLNHAFEIVEECAESELNNRERYWQDFYNVHNENGLNILITASDTEKCSYGCPKPFSFGDSEFISHEINYLGMDLVVNIEFKYPKIDINYTGDFVIREIIHGKYCIKWALSTRSKNHIKNEINRKHNYL